MGDLIQFPKGGRDPFATPVMEFEVSTAPDKCEGYIHVFAEIPGPCKCGAQQWPDQYGTVTDFVGIHLAK